MNQSKLNQFVKLCKENSFSYCEPELKDKMHRMAKAVCRELAKGLGIEGDIRSNKAGIACSGEITLHSDNLYLQIQPDSFMKGQEILFRTCEGKEDYTGGRNHFVGIRDLVDGQKVVSYIKSIV